MDRKQRIVLKHYHTGSEAYPIANDNVPFLFMDSGKTLWFSLYNGGLFKLGRDRKTMVHYGKEAGLTAANVTAMTEDAGGYLWLGTDNGLFRYHPGTETFIRFSKKDRLPSVRFNHSAVCRAGDTLWFGTTAGLVGVDAAKVNYDNPLKPVYFSHIRLPGNDSLIQVNEKNGTQVIRLKYNQNFFTISFFQPELISPDKMRFSCRMEGFEEKWRDLGNMREVTYTNIPPGRYVFTVRTQDWDGRWSSDVSSLCFSVAPPWWRTYWAIGLWICIATGILFTIFRFYRYQERIKQLAHEEELEKNMVKKDNEMKLRFFTNISHEFRTPLALIISPLDILIKNETDEARRKRLSRIRKNAGNLLNLVNQLLDFRKLEMHGEKLNSTFGDLVEFADTIFRAFQENAESEQKELVFLPKTACLYMSFDKDKVRKIVNNLLSNAFKFTTAGAQITLTIDKQEENGQAYAVIRVQDTGCGIRADQLPHVFECFYQEERSQSGNTGSGIGLHIVKEYAELHHGKVKAESVTGKGSSFMVFLPVAPQQASTVTAAQSEQEKTEREILPTETSKNRRKLLIVEDNEEFRHFLAEQLAEDYCVIEAADGEEGEQMALQELPDVIVTDIMMPRVDGMELCKRIKGNIQVSHIPVILLTARASSESMLTGYEAGADEYISKPFDFDVLRMKIHKLIRQQEQRQAQFEHSVEIRPVDITITPLDEEMIQDVLCAIEKHLSNTEYSRKSSE